MSGIYEALSRREREIVSLFIEGYRGKAISNELNITQMTVRNHFRSIFGKFYVNSQDELFQFLSQTEEGRLACDRLKFNSLLEEIKCTACQNFEKVRAILDEGDIVDPQEILPKIVDIFLPVDKEGKEQWKTRLKYYSVLMSVEVGDRGNLRDFVYDQAQPLLGDGFESKLPIGMTKRKFVNMVYERIHFSSLQMLSEMGETDPNYKELREHILSFIEVYHL